jgi:hypothetical protein
MQNEELIPQHMGGALTYQITKIPTFDETGNRKGLVVVGRDVSYKKKTK